MNSKDHKSVSTRQVFQLRLTDPLKARLETDARACNRSLNAHICYLLEISAREYPVLPTTTHDEHELSEKPFSLRLNKAFKNEIQKIGLQCRRSLNTEILLRLLVATGESGAVSDKNSEADNNHASNVAWIRLSSAIDDAIADHPEADSKAIAELVEARAVYQEYAASHRFDPRSG